jgi:hypothetical protein
MAEVSRPASTVDRRKFLKHAGGVLAAAGAANALAWPQASVASAAKAQSVPLPQPKPIPGGLAPGIHVFGPGPPEITLPFSGGPLMGLDVEPTVITDRKGFSALAYHAGQAKGSDGKTYNLETDIRAFQGTYVASNGSKRSGAFALI